MKPEFSEVLIQSSKLHSSPSTDSSIRYIGREKKGETMNKCLIGVAITFAFVVAILTTAFIVRYEDKLSHYEFRISSLEKELASIYEMWEEEYGPLHVSEKDFEYEIPSHDDILFASEENGDDDYASTEDAHTGTEKTIQAENEDKSFGDVKVQTLSRRKRQIPQPELPTYGPEVSRTSDGVPILEKSYLDRTERPAPAFFARYEQPTTTDSEGLRLYEGLQATGGRNEPRSLQNARNFGQNGILPHHRTSASWTERDEKQSSIQLKSGDSHSQEGQQNYRRTSGGRRSSSTFPQTRPSSTLLAAEGAPPTYHRSSRVPATADFLIPPPVQPNTRSIQHAPLQRFGQGDGEVIARVLQTDESELSHNPTAETDSRRHRQGSRRVTPKRQAAFRNSRKIAERDYSGDINIVKAEAWVEGPGKAVAAHYVADVSNLTTSHRNYEGNGRLRNVDGIFAAWKPSKWMETTSPDEEKNFVMNQQGVLTVKKSGLYLIYAQVTYLDEHDINGYVVQVDQDIFLQCTSNTPTHNGRAQSNSCYTSGVRFLEQDARIHLKDIEVNRYSIFRPEKTFFGLMRIGEV